MDLLSAIREALRFTRSTRSMLAQGRPITFHLSPFPVPSSPLRSFAAIPLCAFVALCEILFAFTRVHSRSLFAKRLAGLIQP